jgi:hypothetical protein
MSGDNHTSRKIAGKQSDPGTRRNGRPKTFTAAELLALDLPPVAPVVEGLLHEGVTVFAGKPKMGKSWMMLALAIAVATGDKVLGNLPVQQGEVLYLALEDNLRRLKQRTKKLFGQQPPAGLHLAIDWPRLDEGGLQALDEFLAERPDIKLVIGDTLARLKPQASGRRTQYDEDRRAGDLLIPLAAKHGVAIVLVHHLREMQSEDPLDMIHDSAGLTGGVDSALVLKRLRGEADAYLYGDGRDYENPVELALKWKAITATWTIIGDAGEYTMSEERRAILSVVKSADKPLSPKEITERLNASGVKMEDGSVREMLSQMAKDGQIKNPRRGQYVTPDSKENA